MEELRYDIDQSKENKWMADDEAVCCYQCEANFSLARRKVNTVCYDEFDEFPAPRS